MYYGNTLVIMINFAKSRIEWIQNSRIAATDFISAVHNVMSYHPRKILQINKKNGRKKRITRDPSATLGVNLIDLKNGVDRTGNLLILMFGPGIQSEQDNENINDKIVALVKGLKDSLSSNEVLKIQPLGKSQLTQCRNDVNSLSEILRLYYKIEWLRAYGKLSTKEAKTALEQHDIYKKFVSQ